MSSMVGFGVLMTLLVAMSASAAPQAESKRTQLYPKVTSVDVKIAMPITDKKWRKRIINSHPVRTEAITTSSGVYRVETGMESDYRIGNGGVDMTPLGYILAFNNQGWGIGVTGQIIMGREKKVGGDPMISLREGGLLAKRFQIFPELYTEVDVGAQFALDTPNSGKSFWAEGRFGNRIIYNNNLFPLSLMTNISHNFGTTGSTEAEFNTTLKVWALSGVRKGNDIVSRVNGGIFLNAQGSLKESQSEHFSEVTFGAGLHAMYADSMSISQLKVGIDTKGNMILGLTTSILLGGQDNTDAFSLANNSAWRL